MTAAAITTELSAIADESLFRTNPVWCLNRLVERWEERDRSCVELPNFLRRLLAELFRLKFCLPQRALDGWVSRYGPLSTLETSNFVSQPCPGVVGLIVDIVSPDAWVVPLSAKRAAEWSVEPTLAFRPAPTLQNLLLKLLHTLNLPHIDGVPERFAFALGDPLGRRSNGPSMNVAGLLAVVREANQQPPELDRACAVVQPDGDRLVPVGAMQQKLDAFIRECGSGSLLVRCRGCSESGAYSSFFDNVWEVDSLEKLAQKLDDLRWFDVFLTHQPLNAVDAETVAAQVRRLEKAEHRYTEALNLCNRAERCGFEPEVPTRLRREVRQNVIDLHRHLGAYRKSSELAGEEHRLSRSFRASSYDDHAQADLTFAATLFAPHRFDKICDLLDPWRVKLTVDPLLVTPLTRMKVFNTLGRALVAVGQAGWEDLFHRSEELLSEVEPTFLPRTWCYLAQGYLRNGRLQEAEELLNRIEVHPGLDEMSRWFLRFYQADAARRAGKVWDDPEMDNAVVSPRVGHPFGFYLQATARQQGRDTVNALNRFQRAREFFSQDWPDGDESNIQRFLTDCILLAESAWANDQTRWKTSLEALEQHLVPKPDIGLNEYYTGCVPARGSVPSRAAAEMFLSRVHFF